MSQLVRQLAAAVIHSKRIVAASYRAVHYHILQAPICKEQLLVVSCDHVLCCGVATATAGGRIVTMCCTVVC